MWQIYAYLLVYECCPHYGIIPITPPFLHNFYLLIKKRDRALTSFQCSEESKWDSSIPWLRTKTQHKLIRCIHSNKWTAGKWLNKIHFPQPESPHTAQLKYRISHLTHWCLSLCPGLKAWLGFQTENSLTVEKMLIDLILIEHAVLLIKLQTNVGLWKLESAVRSNTQIWCAGVYSVNSGRQMQQVAVRVLCLYVYLSLQLASLCVWLVDAHIKSFK